MDVPYRPQWRTPTRQINVGPNYLFSCYFGPTFVQPVLRLHKINEVVIKGSDNVLKHTCTPVHDPLFVAKHKKRVILGPN